MTYDPPRITTRVAVTDALIAGAAPPVSGVKTSPTWQPAEDQAGGDRA